MRVLLLLIACVSALLAQAPSISPGGIVNRFSYALPGMPNAGIAQGSIFDVYGSNIGPTTLTQASGFPLPTAISGTSVQVTVAGTAVDVFLFYVAQNQLVGLLPSRTPTGSGTIAITRNGVRTATQPILVVARNLGILTLAQNGQGPAVLQFADGSLNDRKKPIKPGGVGVFYGTGLGPVTFDESRAAILQDVAPPLLAFVNDRAARILYQGRTPGLAGLDQINLEVPAGVSGCDATVYFRYGNVISNLTTISISDSPECVDPPPTDPPPATPSSGILRVAGINLQRVYNTLGSPIIGSPTEILTDTAAASFSDTDLNKIPPSTGQTSSLTQIGGCIVGPLVNTTPSASNPNAVTYLDAGPTISIRGPNGLKQLDKFPTGYAASLGGSGFPGQVPVPPPPYLVPGTYAVDNGAGTPAVPAFNASITFPTPEWKWNEKATTVINRAQGFEITWTGGDSTGWVDIAGTSNLPVSASQPIASGGYFSCRGRASAGRLRVPAEVLLFLPPSVLRSGVPTGAITVSHTMTSVNINLPNYYQAFLNGIFSFSGAITFQ